MTPDSPAPSVTMVEMEDRILQDTDGAYRDELLERLRTHRAALASRLTTGLAPEEYAAVNQLHGAVELAGAVVEKVWHFHHALVGVTAR